MNYAAFGRCIRRHRKFKKWTQEALAEKAGISVSFLGHVERGTRKASMETLVNIARALDVSADILLCDSLESADMKFIRSISRLPEEKQQMIANIAKILAEESADE